jgi:hypothetical protein
MVVRITQRQTTPPDMLAVFVGCGGKHIKPTKVFTDLIDEIPVISVIGSSKVTKVLVNGEWELLVNLLTKRLQ